MDFLGKIITKTPTQPTTSVAGGVWTMQEVARFKAAGIWPSPPPVLELYAWGRGQVAGFGNAQGLGSTGNYSSPKQVGSLTTWSIVSANGYNNNSSSAAIKTDGTLWTWGTNNNGQLGFGNTTNYYSPKQVGALTTWSVVSMGVFQFAAITTSGRLWVCGRNNFGQLGLGNITDYSSPKQVGALTNWASVNTNYKSVLAVKTDGTLWAWGYGAVGGQLGLGNLTNYSSPKQVGALTAWSSAKLGWYHAIANKTDGTIWSWGYGSSGRTGLNTVSNYSSPKQIGALTNWSTVAVATGSSGAIKTDGTLWTWGYGVTTGVGTTSAKSSPVQVGALTTWTQLNFSKNGARATQSNGTLWTWGTNTNGQLGINNLTNYSSPVQIGALTTWNTGPNTIASATQTVLAIKTS